MQQVPEQGDKCRAFVKFEFQNQASERGAASYTAEKRQLNRGINQSVNQSVSPLIYNL